MADQATLKDIKMIYSIHSRMDYKNMAEVGKVCNKLIERDGFTSEIGSKYISKLSDIMLETDNAECIFCHTINEQAPVICNGCAKKLSARFMKPKIDRQETLGAIKEEQASEPADTTEIKLKVIQEEQASESTGTLEIKLEGVKEEQTFESTDTPGIKIESIKEEQASESTDTPGIKIESIKEEQASESTDTPEINIETIKEESDIESSDIDTKSPDTDIESPDTEIDYSLDIEFLELAAAMEAISAEGDIEETPMFSSVDSESELGPEAEVQDDGPGSFMESLSAMQAENNQALHNDASATPKKNKNIFSGLFKKRG